MPTNRLRKVRTSINRIPLNITKEYFGELECRDFLAQDRAAWNAEFSEDEKKLVNEFSKCDWKFEKWLKFREGKRAN